MGPPWVLRALTLAVVVASCCATETETAAAESIPSSAPEQPSFFHNPPPPAPYRFSPDYELYNFYMQHNSLPFYHHEMVFPNADFAHETMPQAQSVDDIPPTSTFLELDSDMWARTHGASRSEASGNAAAASQSASSTNAAGGGATDDKSSVEDFSTLSDLQQQSQESEAEDQDLFENNPRLDGMGHKSFNSYYGLPRFAEARAAAKVKHKAKQVAKFELQTWTYANTKEPPEWLVPPSMSPPGVPLTKPPPVPQMVPPPPPFPGYLDNHGPYSGAGSEAPVPPAYNLPRPPPSILPRWIPWSAYYVPTDK